MARFNIRQLGPAANRGYNLVDLFFSSVFLHTSPTQQSKLTAETFVSKYSGPTGFEIAAASMPKPAQPKSSNADCCIWSMTEDSLTAILLVVCDGVSSSKNGSRAARMTCESIKDQFDSDFGDGSDGSSWLQGALVKPHDAVRFAYPTGDAHCTVVAAIVLPDSKQLFVANAGDSPAFLFDASSFEQQTQDHLTTVFKQSPGARNPSLTRALTMFIGINGEFNPDVVNHSYEGGGYICLASDGVSSSSVEHYVRTLTGTPTSEGVLKCCDHARDLSDDDATLLVLRLGLSEVSADVNAELSRYASLNESARQSLLDRASKIKQLDTRTLFSCFKLESNEPRATTLLLLMQADAGAMSKPEWI